jgi:hypothetical protein
MAARSLNALLSNLGQKGKHGIQIGHKTAVQEIGAHGRTASAPKMAISEIDAADEIDGGFLHTFGPF